MSTTTTVPSRRRPIPGADRLLMLWQCADVPISPLEHAALICGHLWVLTANDENNWDALSHLGAGGTSPELEGLDREVVRAMDDEITWYLGNRPDTVHLLDNDSPERTVGQMISRLAVLATPLLYWEGGPHQCPFYPRFRAIGDEYDALTDALIAGYRRQPRQRADGTPPIPPPLQFRTRR
ncbi:hypothetical protein [Nocardia bovistercoris]|uniref:Uncharacterized protein n=1 Tax=Nocardia bovistercoris TaxID=2785916 RepID=A0A931IB09_9NOCA|nr:hypothetical protein [Nocardia bovistercoris]MBH0777716.1 hypothetical protein [Nocardia bovistercoris]